MNAPAAPPRAYVGEPHTLSPAPRRGGVLGRKTCRDGESDGMIQHNTMIQEPLTNAPFSASQRTVPVAHVICSMLLSS